MARRPPGLIFVAACVAALALRLLMPAGFMPAGEGMALSICNSVAQETAPAPPLTGEAGKTCDFALTASPLLLALALVLVLLLPAVLPAAPFPAGAPLLRRRRPCPPSRGPPRR
jgi:hypothetical protein